MEIPDNKILTTSRGPVEYVESGSGEVVLSLHGAMGGYDQALLLTRTIGEKEYRYLSISRPGYLGTPLKAGRTPEEQADLYAEFLGLLYVRQAIVMAISGGGPGAIHFALRHREMCRGLVLISTCAGRTKDRVPLSFHISALFSRWPAFVNLMRNRAEKNLREVLARSISDPDILERTLKDNDIMILYRELVDEGFNRMSERIKGTKNDIHITRTRTYPLKDIAVPTLVIHGTKDPFVPFEEHGKRLAAEIPGALLLAAEGGEHVTIFTHRTEVREKLSKFLRELS